MNREKEGESGRESDCRSSGWLREHVEASNFVKCIGAGLGSAGVSFGDLSCVLPLSARVSSVQAPLL